MSARTHTFGLSQHVPMAHSQSPASRPPLRAPPPAQSASWVQVDRPTHEMALSRQKPVPLLLLAQMQEEDVERLQGV